MITNSNDSANSDLHGSAPFLKWPGGKRRVVPHLLPHLNLPAKRLVEPFCGSCALSLAVGDRADSFWLNDLNGDLVKLLEQVKLNPAQVIKRGKSYFTPAKNVESIYYDLRDEFNTTKDQFTKALLFLYLNRHGYNGLCRYNADGGFNVPFGRYVAPYFPEKEILAAADVLARAEITARDFGEVMGACGLGDVVYCDPPYVPLSTTASFTSYSAGGFGKEEQERLALVAGETAARGALVVISNHDTRATQRLYKKAGAQNIINSIPVRRNISCNGDNRALVKEIIAVFTPKTPSV